MCPDGLSRTAKIGILGGGQLGRMLAIAAAPMGVRLHSLDPNPSSPASIAAISTTGSFQNRDDVLSFAKDCDVVTVEIEHIDVAALEELEALGVDVQPTSRTLGIIQDKFAQKEHFAAAGVPLGEYRSVKDQAELDGVAGDFGFPAHDQISPRRVRRQRQRRRANRGGPRGGRSISSAGSTRVCTARSGCPSRGSSR
jgi:phosphoribosylaminoimidazole carboxylase